MKNILIVSGSPRPKGNTYKMMQLIENRMHELGDYTFEWLYLKNADLKYCKGCLQCMKKAESHCPCKDDAEIIKEKLLSADGIVFASPVYVHTVSALMKNFFDRFAWMCHRPRCVGKSALLLVTTELSGMDETLDYMAFPINTWGMTIADHVGAVYPSFKDNPVYHNRIENRFNQAADKFHHQLQTLTTDYSLPKLAFFHLMKFKVTLHKKMLPYDYQFWADNGWLDKSFYDDSHVPKLKSSIAKAMVKLRANSILKKAGVSLSF